MNLAGTIRGEIEPSRTLPRAAASGGERRRAATNGFPLRVQNRFRTPASPAAGLPSQPVAPGLYSLGASTKLHVHASLHVQDRDVDGFARLVTARRSRFRESREIAESEV